MHWGIIKNNEDLARFLGFSHSFQTSLYWSDLHPHHSTTDWQCFLGLILQPYSSFQERGLDYSHRYFCLQWSTVHIAALILSLFSWWIELLICLHCDGMQPQPYPAYHLFAVTLYSKVKTDFFLDKFTKLRKVTFSFVMSASHSACLSTWNNSIPTGQIFMKFGTWVFFENLSSSLKYDKSNWYFTWRPL